MSTELIMYRLDEVKEAQDRVEAKLAEILEKRLPKIEREIGLLRLKSTLWGFTAGSLPVIVTWIKKGPF